MCPNKSQHNLILSKQVSLHAVNRSAASQCCSALLLEDMLEKIACQSLTQAPLQAFLMVCTSGKVCIDWLNLMALRDLNHT